MDKELGWSGLLVEANTKNYVKLEESRLSPRVLTLHAGACATPSLLWLNGARAMAQTADAKMANTVALCMPMSQLETMAGIAKIDFFSIDVEGAETLVIETHDWVTVPVRVAIVEMRPVDEKSLANAKTREALHKKGLCRYAADMGHCNEVWINPVWEK